MEGRGRHKRDTNLQRGCRGEGEIDGIQINRGMMGRDSHRRDTNQQRDAEKRAKWTVNKSAEGWREEGAIDGIQISRGMQRRGRNRRDTNQHGGLEERGRCFPERERHRTEDQLPYALSTFYFLLVIFYNLVN